MLRQGLRARVTADEAASGTVTLSIPRRQARLAHLRVGSGQSVVIARGTVSSIRKGTVTLRIRLGRQVAAKLRRLKHMTIQVRMSVVSRTHERQTVDAAGRY